MSRHPFLGMTLLEITQTDRGTVVGCACCGAQEVFARTDEPSIAHLWPDCPVFRAVVAAERAFIDMSGGPWLT